MIFVLKLTAIFFKEHLNCLKNYDLIHIMIFFIKLTTISFKEHTLGIILLMYFLIKITIFNISLEVEQVITFWSEHSNHDLNCIKIMI